MSGQTGGALVPLVMRVVASSLAVATRAGAIVRDVMSKGDLGIVEKGKNDYQTEADRSAQHCIISSLAKQYPNIKIIGEEDDSAESQPKIPNDWLILEGDEDFLKKTCPEALRDVKEEDIVIWVDPLDGTSEYTQGFLEHVTVLIGISVNEKPIGGVIHQPYFKDTSSGQKKMGRTIWGVEGLGVGGYTPSPPPESLVVTTTRSHSNALVESALQVLNPTQILRVGGAGYKVLQLLEGKASVYVFASAGCKKWDTCAPEAVLNATGGKLTDILGQSYKYGAGVEKPNKTGVLAAVSADLHKFALDKIPQELKDKLANK